MDSTSLRVIIIEDNDLLRDCYAYYLESSENFRLCGLFSNVNDALQEYENIYPDIIISDISLPGMSGLDAIAEYRKRDISVKILLASIHDNSEKITKAIDNSIDGYITKPITKQKLLSALTDISQGGSPLSPNISKIMMKMFNSKKNVYRPFFDSNKFTKREIEILNFYTKGLTYNDISEKLFISSSTVNFHIQKIYDKLNVRSKSEALKKLQANSL